jgi:hypothetical protein
VLKLLVPYFCGTSLLKRGGWNEPWHSYDASPVSSAHSSASIIRRNLEKQGPGKSKAKYEHIYIYIYISTYEHTYSNYKTYTKILSILSWSHFYQKLRIFLLFYWLIMFLFFLGTHEFEKGRHSQLRQYNLSGGDDSTYTQHKKVLWVTKKNIITYYRRSKVTDNRSSTVLFQLNLVKYTDIEIIVLRVWD